MWEVLNSENFIIAAGCNVHVFPVLISTAMYQDCPWECSETMTWFRDSQAPFRPLTFVFRILRLSALALAVFCARQSEM
jgi:hypothetical protein